jgi:DNA invertase Pin-like site-specific DNA recombinase
MTYIVRNSRKKVPVMTKIVGYARVSTGSQSAAAQIEALKAAGADVVFQETASGAKRDRAQMIKAIGALEKNDTFLVTRLDRFARSTQDLLNRLEEVANKGAKFKSLADAWADTTTPHGKLFLTILGGLAEFERELIKARTDEGRRRAIERGVKMGRRLKLTPHQRDEVIKRRDKGESLMDLARSYGVTHPTIMLVLRTRDARQ